MEVRRNQAIKHEIDTQIKNQTIKLGWTSNITEYTIDYDNIVEYHSERIGEDMYKVPVIYTDNTIKHTNDVVLYKSTIDKKIHDISLMYDLIEQYKKVIDLDTKIDEIKINTKTKQVLIISKDNIDVPNEYWIPKI